MSTHTRTVLGAVLAFGLFTGAASTFAQEQPRPQAPAQPPSAEQPSPQQPAQPSPQPRAQAAQTQTARGELTSVDATAKMITIKPLEGAEQKFQYSDSTKVTGDRAGVAGLATLSGKQVTVHFSSQGANRMATEIAVEAEKK